jgi:ubiquinone/menaquinone biosynthesis C-methylase UbiE
MSLAFKIRDLCSPRSKVLREVGIEKGAHVLDYGCGPGSYLLPLAEAVGHSGIIYALDLHPLAIEKIQRIAADRGLNNVKTIQSDGKTDLPDHSVDVVLLYDVFHELFEPGNVLGELHRVLKPAGILSFSDHHLWEKDILKKVTAKNLFRLSQKGRKTYTFSRIS